VGIASGSASPDRPGRLRARSDFARVMRRGRRSRHALLQCVASRNVEANSRIGYSVSKQVGGAVVRNRVKRRLRMIVREFDWAPGFDVVIVARPEARSATYGELRQAVQENADRLKLRATEDR